LAAPAKIINSTRSWLGRHRLLAVFSILSLLVVLFIIIPLAKLIFVSNKGDLWQALLDPTHEIYFTHTVCRVDHRCDRVSAGVPLAYLLARNSFPLKGVVEA